MITDHNSSNISSIHKLLLKILMTFFYYRAVCSIVMCNDRNMNYPSAPGSENARPSYATAGAWLTDQLPL